MARDPAATVRIDWQACRGRGLCHELLPELIVLDDWGYPIVTGPVPARLMADARSAVRACPRLALSLVAATSSSRVRGTQAGSRRR
jgi:ferredoxin